MHAPVVVAGGDEAGAIRRPLDPLEEVGVGRGHAATNRRGVCGEQGVLRCTQGVRTALHVFRVERSWKPAQLMRVVEIAVLGPSIKWREARLIKDW